MATMTRRRRIPVAAIVRILIFIAAILMYFIPLVSSGLFGLTLPKQGLTLAPLRSALAGNTNFMRELLASFMLMVTSAFASLALLLPTLVWLHLRGRHLLGLAEGLSILPFVVPAIALVNGVSLFFNPIVPGFLASIYSLIPLYVVLSLPLVFRALDTGVRSVDLRTLFDAASSLGASRLRIIVGVLLPNMWGAVMVSVLLSFVMGLGEFVLANLLLHDTFPVFINTIGATNPRAAAALSFFVIVGTWLMMAGVANILGRTQKQYIQLM